ncbi:MAG: Fic family protein [bacterium]
MKNETKNAPRLESILNLLASGPLSRLNLQASLQNITRPTLLRDLQKLLLSGQIITLGTGRSTLYQLADYNPLLSHPRSRDLNLEIRFNPTIFDHLHHLLTPAEQSLPLRNLHEAIQILGPIITKKEKERFIIDFAWKSSAIEGNTYTLSETATLLTTGSPAISKTSYETQMILNHRDTLNYIWDHPLKPNQLSLDYILHIHTLLTAGLNIKPGIRHLPVGISGSLYLPLTNPQTIFLSLKQTIEIINQTQNPLEKTLIAVAMLSYIQPFVDGNKRTARTIGNVLLLSHNLIPISYRTVDEKSYCDALLLFYEQNSLLTFKNLLLEQLTFSHSHYFRTK